MIPLNSSVIAGISYQEWTRTLVVHFHSGRSYSHPGVPPQIVSGLLHASSAGQYYNAHIRGHYR